MARLCAASRAAAPPLVLLLAALLEGHPAAALLTPVLRHPSEGRLPVPKSGEVACSEAAQLEEQGLLLEQLASEAGVGEAGTQDEDDPDEVVDDRPRMFTMKPNQAAQVASVVNGSYRGERRMWPKYQKKLLKKLTATFGKSQGAPLKVLVVSPMSNTLRAVYDFKFNMDMLRKNKARDIFHYALFHYEGTDSVWQPFEWYSNNSKVVMKETRQRRTMCKQQAWLLVGPELARRYDYLWLMDGDLRLDFFSWDIYRAVLTALDPLVSQPAVVPRNAGARSTDLPELQMVGQYGKGFPVVREVSRSESMTPVLSARLWPALHARFTLNDQSTVWHTNTVWDIIAQLAAGGCGKPSVLLVNAAPVRHMDCHDLFAHKCTRGCGTEQANCRPFVESEKRLIQNVTRDYCTIDTQSPALDCGHIMDCKETVSAKLSLRQWVDHKEREIIEAVRYSCNYTDRVSGFASPCASERLASNLTPAYETRLRRGQEHPS